MNTQMKSSHRHEGNFPVAAIASAGLAAVTLAVARKASAVTPALTFADIPGTGDVKVLNYALALEDLESDLYAQAYQRLTNGGVNRLGTQIPGLGLDRSQLDVQLTGNFGQVEADHRNLLRKTLGHKAIKTFKYNFGMESLDRKGVLDLLYTAESTGVGAYLGAIPFLATTKYLQIAGSIQGTEARHTAVFAELINMLFAENLEVAPTPSENNGRDMPLDPNVVLARVSPFIVVG